MVCYLDLDMLSVTEELPCRCSSVSFMFLRRGSDTCVKTETSLRQAIETSTMTLCPFRKKICSTKCLNMFKLQVARLQASDWREETENTYSMNIARHSEDSLTNVIYLLIPNSCSPLRYYLQYIYEIQFMKWLTFTKLNINIKLQCLIMTGFYKWLPFALFSPAVTVAVRKMTSECVNITTSLS